MQVTTKSGSSSQSNITTGAGRAAQTGARKGAKKPDVKTRSRSTKTSVKAVISGAQRHQLISEAAYFKAEQRGFEVGNAVQDWLEAEAHIDAMYRIEG